jgi:hypothetical protein
MAGLSPIPRALLEGTRLQIPVLDGTVDISDEDKPLSHEEIKRAQVDLSNSRPDKAPDSTSRRPNWRDFDRERQTIRG